MIAIAGGSGILGTFLVERLVKRGLPVRVLTRDRAHAAHLSGVELCVGDVRDPAAAAELARGASIVVSLVHGFIDGSPASVDRAGNATLIAAAEQAGAEVVLMSGVGASATAPLELMRMKHAAEECVRASRTRWTIVRASTFLETWVRLLKSTANGKHGPLVFGRGENPINFVSARDVAALLEHVIVDPKTRGEVLELAGTEDFTLAQLASAIAASAHLQPPKHIPRAALHVASVVTRPFRPQFARQCRAALTLDVMDARYSGDSARSRYADLPSITLRDVLAASS